MYRYLGEKYNTTFLSSVLILSVMRFLKKYVNNFEVSLSLGCVTKKKRKRCSNTYIWNQLDPNLAVQMFGYFKK